MTLYTIDCPACQVLEKKLAQKGLSYNTVNDLAILTEMGFTAFPILEVDGALLSFKEAVEWVNQQEV